jgi:hypothetical protein
MKSSENNLSIKSSGFKFQTRRSHFSGTQIAKQCFSIAGERLYVLIHSRILKYV